MATLQVSRYSIGGVANHDHPADLDNVPTVSCSRCDRQWDVEYELNELHAGNDAVEQFALDHERHTGHYPEDVTPWIVTCKRCPDGERFLRERAARRWATAHARHTRHEVELRAPGGDENEITASQ